METSEAKRKTAMEVQPQKEHRWLRKFIGEWVFEGSATVEPGRSPETFTGTERVRALGELWILAEGQGEMPGMGASSTVMTLGYDPRKGRFVGAYFMSVMPNLWVYDGALDPEEKALMLDTEGPGMGAAGEMSQFRDVIEFRSDDHRVMTSHIRDEAGEWHEFSRVDYRRKK